MKSFKKTLAALLAALMVICSVPFTALAVEDVPGDVTISLAAYDYQCGDNFPPAWGPYLESGSGEGAQFDADKVISSGSYFAIAFIAHDVVDIGMQQMQIRGWFDDSKIATAYYTQRTQGRKTMYTFNHDSTGVHSGEATIFTMASHDGDSVVYSSSDQYTVSDGVNFFGSTSEDGLVAAKNYGWPKGDSVPVQEICLAATNGFTGTPLQNTSINYVYNPDSSGWDGSVVFDEVLIGVISAYALEDIKVSDLYDVFHFDETNHSDNQWVAEDANSRHTVKVAPYEKQEPVEEVVYQFNDGHTQNVTDGSTPDNTKVKTPINNENGTHTTEYKWVEDVTETYDYVEEAVTAPCTMQKSEDAIPGTCVTEGKTQTDVCSACGYTTGGESTGYDYQNHNYGAAIDVPSTCTDYGYDLYECQDCQDGTEGHSYKDNYKQELAPHTFDYEGSYEVTLQPTKSTPGTKEYTCTSCGVAKDTKEIPALGVNITIVNSELGTVDVNGADGSNATTNVPYGSSYTITAKPTDGAKVVGWMSNGKMVTTEASYTTAAYADTTYTAVFAEEGHAAFTVTFMDNYGNVIAIKHSDELAAMEAMPTPPTLAGYKFVEWSMELDAVKALTESTVVTAQYESDDAKTYTVTATGCTIDVDGEVSDDVATDVAYNSKVTVTPKSGTAASWTANGATAAYGESYTFYCGSDIELTYSESPVTPVPTVAKIKAEKTNSHVVAFLATRSVADGYTLVESGFVYGKAMAEDDLTLDNVGTVKGTDGGKVKYIACQNVAADGQFSLNYGVTAMNQNACARAYLIYTDNATSETHVIYSDAMIYSY